MLDGFLFFGFFSFFKIQIVSMEALIVEGENMWHCSVLIILKRFKNMIQIF